MFLKNYFRHLFIVYCACIAVSTQAQTKTTNKSPWGVSTHYISWAPQGEKRDELLNYAKDAGIKFMREDITFTTVCYEPGKMHFELIDELIESIRSVGAHPLPILHAFTKNWYLYFKGRR